MNTPALLLATLLCAVSVAIAAEPPLAPGTQTIRFASSAEQSSAEEVKARLHSIEQPGAFDITTEKFQLIVPKNYKPAEPWGLFIWISAGDDARIPADWEAVLAERKLLFVGGLQSGNKRNIFDRIRMAVDASVGMRKRCRVDERRVYVSGFSGGARVASMLGVCYADLFNGTMPFMGVNFYTDVVGSDGKKYGISYLPDDEVLEIAKKKCRYVLVTAEKDFNRPNTLAAAEQGFRKEGFPNVLTLEVPGLAHAVPDGKWLAKGLDFLDEGKRK
jgi:dienelactone hydrolase